MRKPDLKRTYDFSTAVTDLRRTGTHHTNFSPFSVSTTAKVIHPTVSPFLIVPPLNDKPYAASKNEPKKKEANQSLIDWTDTKDIQAIVARTIETDIEQSIERNFGTERYVFSGERVCAEKELSIPQEVKQEIMKRTNQRPNQKNVQVNYGYLSYANAVYYIIDQYLYVFRIEDLKERTRKETVGNEILDLQPMMPVKLRQVQNQNCRKIHEINFSDNLKGFSSLNLLSKRALILEYPYHLEIVNYKFQQIPSNSNKLKEIKKTIFSLISLGMCFSIESERADFITITPANTLLYIDQNGVLVNCIITRPNGKLKKIIKKESFLQRKSTFLSKCNSFMRKMKQVAFQTLPFSFSFQLSKRKNLALVYDERRSRVFTWTLKGDRSTIIQKLQKEIKVYEFVPTFGGRMNCIWSIPEEQILRELDYPVDPPKVFVESILKADPDYNQQASLIILLSNGMKSYLEIGKQQCKFRWKCHPPQVASLKKAVYRKNDSLFEIANLKAGKESNAIMMDKWSEKFGVESSKNNQQVSFSYFNDRSISIGLVRSQNRMGMYLTVRKNYQKSDFYDVFDVNFNNEFFKKRLDSFPTKNSIFQNKCITFSVENSLRVTQLEQFETIQQLMSSTKYTHPNPTTEGSHELLRQVHHGPRHFTYLSNHFISTFVLLRPVDIVYYFVKFQRDTFCQNYLSSIICVNLSEISYMLLQIYTAPEGTSYFVPKNYMQKIEDILKEMHSNTKKVDTYASTNLQSTFLNKNKKRLESYRNQNYDQLIEFRKEANDDLLKTNIRSLFASFCIQQKFSNHNVFQNVKLQNVKKSSEEIDFETNVKKLSQQHKVQAKNCLVYISRVLYPFWNAKTLSLKKGEVYIQTIKKKVQELDDIVTLLKRQGNEYWHHLGSFLQKIHQIIEIFIWIQKIPYGLTLSEAMQKNLQYFEPFIFETLQYNYQANLIHRFKQLFPLYITTEFETLIKIYKLIAKSTREKQIKRHLEALTSYPQYFINYLKRQKPFIDHTALMVRDNLATYENEPIEMPVMPFARLLPFYFQKINNLSVKITQKFIYLKLVNQKLQEQKTPNLPGKQIVESHYLAKFQAEYDETLKCLKLQQKCKQVIEEILQEEMMKQQTTGTENRRKSGFLTSFFSQFTGFFGEQSQEKRQNLSKKSYQIKRKVHQLHRTIFEKLDYYTMKKKDFAELLSNMKNSYLDILYISIFWNHNIKQSDITSIRQSLKQRFKDLVKKGYTKFQNAKKAHTDDHYERERYKNLVTYIKNRVIKIFSFIKSTHTYLDIPAFYDGLTSELFEHDFTLLSIIQTTSKHDKQQTQTYSIPTHLAENAFDTKQITDHIIGKILVPFFNSRNFEQSSQKHTIIKKWIYQWFMLADMVIKYNKNDAQRLIHIMQDFKILNKELLGSNPLNIYQPALVSKMRQLLALQNESEVII